MQNIAVIFGGRSVEHDISIITGLGIIKNISAKYNVIPIYITRNGEWLTGENLTKKESFLPTISKHAFSSERKKGEAGVNCLNNCGDFKSEQSGNCVNDVRVKGKVCYIENNEPFLVYNKGFGRSREHIDCAVLALHGGEYEGGAVQGLLTLARIPFTSAGCFGSSACMDKVATKHLLRGLKINTTRYIWGESVEEIMTKLKKAHLSYPLIVKPACCGSSIGISKVENRETLGKAVEYALKFDTKVLVEECLVDFRELSVSALKSGDEIKCSSIEEVLGNGDVFNFAEKYCDQKVKRQVPADIGKELAEQIFDTTRLVYRELGLNGVVRVDYLFANSKLYLNEINTIPGSLAFYLWRGQGIGFSRLITLMIEQTIRDFNAKQNITYTYPSTALNALASVDKIISK